MIIQEDNLTRDEFKYKSNVQKENFRIHQLKSVSHFDPPDIRRLKNWHEQWSCDIKYDSK